MNVFMEHRRSRLAEGDVSGHVNLAKIDAIETYQACLAGIVSCATHGPTFAVPRGEVVATVTVELLCLSLDWCCLCWYYGRQRLCRRVGVPLLEEVGDVGRCLAGGVAASWSR